MRTVTICFTLLFTISNFKGSLCGFEEVEDHNIQGHLKNLWEQVGSYLQLLVEDPRISGNPNNRDIPTDDSTDPITDVSILILQIMFEFLQNHGTEIHHFYKTRAYNERLEPEELNLLDASAGFNIDKLYFIHDRYREAADKVYQLVRDFFENTPKDAPAYWTPEQAMKKLTLKILASLLRM